MCCASGGAVVHISNGKKCLEHFAVRTGIYKRITELHGHMITKAQYIAKRAEDNRAYLIHLLKYGARCVVFKSY